MENLRKTSNAADPLFAACFHEAALHHYKGDLPPKLSAEVGMEELWQQLLEAPIWSRRGSRQKASRWFQWVSEMSSIATSFGFLLVVVLRVVVERGWYKTIHDTPWCKGLGGEPPEHRTDLDKESAPQPIDDVLSRDTGASAAQAEEGMANARKQAKNTMHLAANILCSGTSLKLMKVIMVFGSISQERHNDQVVRCKTQRGGMTWWAEESAGAWEKAFLRSQRS